MCGLFGAYSTAPLNAKTREVVRTLAYLSIFRGKDSSGIATVDMRDKVSVIKECLPVPDFLKLPSVIEELDRADLKVIIGHARHATVGGKTIKGAHPFQFANTVGAHNGTIDRMCISQYLEKDTEEKYLTDSEAIFAKINSSSYTDVIPELEGAWALTSWDKENKTLNIIRNDKRTLFWVALDDKKTIIWSSQRNMLEFAISCTPEVNLVTDKKNQYFIRPFEENKLHVISPDKDGIVGSEITKLASTKKYSYVSTYVYSPAANHSSTHTQTNIAANKSATNIVPFKVGVNVVTESPLQVMRNIAPLVDNLNKASYQKDAYDQLITKDEFLDAFEEKCILCGSKVDYDKGLVIVPDAPYDPICHTCLSDDPYLYALTQVMKEKVA